MNYSKMYARKDVLTMRGSRRPGRCLPSQSLSRPDVLHLLELSDSWILFVFSVCLFLTGWQG